MSASTQRSFSDTRPTALVVVKADIAEITRVPGCNASTSLTMPSNGARTMAWSSWRCISSTFACAFMYSGAWVAGMFGLPLSLASWTSAFCCSEVSVACAVCSVLRA